MPTLWRHNQYEQLWGDDRLQPKMRQHLLSYLSEGEKIFTLSFPKKRLSGYRSDISLIGRLIQNYIAPVSCPRHIEIKWLNANNVTYGFTLTVLEWQSPQNIGTVGLVCYAVFLVMRLYKFYRNRTIKKSQNKYAHYIHCVIGRPAEAHAAYMWVILHMRSIC